MRMLSGFLALVLLLGTVPVVWAQADPAKEVADITRKRAEAAARGDVEHGWQTLLTTWYLP